MAALLAVVLAAVEIALDAGTWVELNVSIVYSLPLVLAAAARDRRLLRGLTLLMVCMTFAVYFAQIGPHVFSFRETFFLDRVLAALTVVLTAVLLDNWTQVVDLMDEQGRSLARQNEQLEAINLELASHKEEIVRQNELLERRRQEAEEASGRKTRLLASASHDIRTPVNAINIMAEVIRRSAQNPLTAGQVPGMAQRLQANALALSGLLAEILDLTSFDSGRVELRDSEFSVNDLLTEAHQQLLPMAEARGLRFTMTLPEPPLRLRTDRLKLARIVGNLLGNAIKSTPRGTVSVCALLTPQKMVQIEVRDTGVGMAPELLRRALGEPAQAAPAGRQHDEGWGLGLAICQRLARLLGASLEVESAPDHGTVFRVCLPALACPPGT
jgi:signal transduction histidine kinase